MIAAVDLGCSAYVLRRSGEIWTVCWYRCRSKRQGVVGRQKEGSNHVRLEVGEGEDGKMRND